MTFQVHTTVIAPSNMNRVIGGGGGTNMPMPAIDALSHEAPLNYLPVEVFCDYATINLLMFSSRPKLNVCLVRAKKKDKQHRKKKKTKAKEKKKVLPGLSLLILKCLKWS